MQPDDDIIIPQDDLYVITWETNFGEFPNSTEEVTIPTRLTEADPRSTYPHRKGDFDLTQKTHSESTNDWNDDAQSSGGSDTIVSEVSDDENDDMIEYNESPWGGTHNFRPNPTPNFTDEYRY